MLKVRQLIPPLTARTSHGQTVQAWDYKQKKSLVIAFLHAGCARCEEWVGWLSQHAAEMAECDAVALVILPAMSLPVGASRGLGTPLQSVIHVAADVSGRSQCAFLGSDGPGAERPASLGVFVTDRYGELHAQWLAQSEDGLPPIRDVLSWLSQIQVACEECGAPHSSQATWTWESQLKTSRIGGSPSSLFASHCACNSP